MAMITSTIKCSFDKDMKLENPYREVCDHYDNIIDILEGLSNGLDDISNALKSRCETLERCIDIIDE